MRWLFALFVASLCALLWAAIAVARHVRRDREQLPAEAGAAETDEKQDRSLSER
jgi:cytoskeletal protein RodZ